MSPSLLLILSVWVRDLTAPQPVPAQQQEKHLFISQIAAANHSPSQSESDETACEQKFHTQSIEMHKFG